MVHGKKVRIAIVGVGCRGFFSAQLLSQMEDVEILAICDVKYERMSPLADELYNKTGIRPSMYNDYKDIIIRNDIDMVYIYTSWQAHVKIAVDAMNHGKDVAMEIGGASSVEECWQLVKAQEKTGRFFMFLENCCYDRKELALLNMIRQGIFGEIVHCQCGYEHDLRDEVCNGGEFGSGHYRLDHYLSRNCDLYPTHGLGPVAMMLNINRGNRMVSLVSMSGKARGCEKWVKENLPADHRLQGVKFTQGDVVNTLVRCYNGETILLTHDTTLPRPYSRALRVQGTKGIYMEDGNNIYIENISPLHEWQNFHEYMERYDHPIWKDYLSLGVKEGHGGIDYLVQRACIDAWKNGDRPPIDVYDAASWMVITALSEESIAKGSVPVEIPDFTGGKWQERKNIKEENMAKYNYIPVWECSACGNINTGIYCPKCGKKNEGTYAGDTWICSCGKANNGNFCVICGESKNNVGKNDEWLCSCGRKNTTRFCIKCGSKRPQSTQEKDVNACSTEWVCECGETNTDERDACLFCDSVKDEAAIQTPVYEQSEGNNEEAPSCVSENAEPMEPVPADEIVNVEDPAVTESSDAPFAEVEDEWTCECGEINAEDVCESCGAQRGEEDIFKSPVYEEVIYMDNDAPLCVSENAEPMEPVSAEEIVNVSSPDCIVGGENEAEPEFIRDENIESWVCSCGTRNTTRFCIDCGRGKTEPQIKEYKYCKACGSKLKRAAKFCNQCGEKQ
ncbi:MAG: Gfo/Idh/MocA family oxidoreductase [Clostridiales bacterium]|nr:Gfo/Idh/MocA family oxidoreductase [Clostridiales bacterium]